MSIKRGKGIDGSHFEVTDDGGYRTNRANNGNLTSIPKKDCLLRIYCYAPRVEPRLIGLVTRYEMTEVIALAFYADDLWTREGDLAAPFVPCHCGQKPPGWTGVDGHRIVLAKVWAELDRRRDSRTRRPINVRDVEANS